MSLPAFSIAACLCLSSSVALADGDAVAGRRVFGKCAPCHTATEQVNRVGPSLMGVIGRPVASVADYRYSKAMQAFGADGKVWDEALISEYLLAPKALVPDTRMTFAGLRKPIDIADLVAYLKTAAPAP